MATTRAQIQIADIPAAIQDQQLGILVAFTHSVDAYSPQMLLVYDEFTNFLEGAVPLVQIDMANLANESGRDSFLIYSTPTLEWIRPYSDPQIGRKVEIGDDILEIIMRHVGTVMLQKLETDAQQLIEKLSG